MYTHQIKVLAYTQREPVVTLCARPLVSVMHGWAEARSTPAPSLLWLLYSMPRGFRAGTNVKELARNTRHAKTMPRPPGVHQLLQQKPTPCCRGALAELLDPLICTAVPLCATGRSLLSERSRSRPQPGVSPGDPERRGHPPQ